jgi:sucrose-phosphate synthase
LFIAFLNPQGNFDRNDSRWASHPDFGGQLVYVKEVAIELARMGHKVDIVTRQIIDKEWPEFSESFDAYEGVDNLRIVRIKFGPDKFLNKEALWPFICTEYIDNLIALYKKENHMPDVVTSHYGDGGLSAACFKNKTGIPYTFTGHSLGAQKMDKLKVNKHNIEDLNNTYNFTSRLLAERVSMNSANKIITSTTQERFSQYTHTAYQEAVVADNDDKFAVIPPGVSLRVFDEAQKLGMDDKLNEYIDEKIARDITKDRLGLPCIVSSSRLDPKKNIAGLVKAFAESKALQESANLVILTKGYDNPLLDYQQATNENERQVLIELIDIINQNNLSGKIAMFSIENQKDLGNLYRYLSKRRSVFCLTALYEPFGLAPLEAMACELPAVVTKFGGPTESLREDDQDFGLLVDPNDPEDTAGALYKLVSSERVWEEYSLKGYQRVFDKYTWKRTAEGYYGVLEEIVKKKEPKKIFELGIDKYFSEPSLENKPGLEVLYDIYLNYDVLAIGETVIDFISTKKTNSLRDAETYTRYLGGNPAYVSVYVSKLSKKAVLLTKLGVGHFCNFLEKELQKCGVSTEYIAYSDKKDTSMSFICQTPTIPDFHSIHSADRKLDIKDIDPDIIERAKVIHTSLSSVSYNPARSAIRKALRIGKKTGKILTLDPNYHPQIWPEKEEALEILAQLCDGITIVTPSIVDARHLFDYNMPEDELVELSIKKFHEWGAKIVVVTAKGRYVVISNGGETIRIEDLPEIDVVDVSGGGAAFISGFIVAYLEKLDLEKCVRFGHEVAKNALQSVGPYPKSIFRSDILSKIQ